MDTIVDNQDVLLMMVKR